MFRRVETFCGLRVSLVASVLFSAVAIVLVQHAAGHARLVEPPSRNTLWRFGYHAAPNFEDSELFCGGIKVRLSHIWDTFVPLATWTMSKLCMINRRVYSARFSTYITWVSYRSR